jgi:hypothetical protein
MSGIGYPDVEQICDELSDLRSLDVAVREPGCVRVRGALRVSNRAEPGDSLIAFQRSVHRLLEALERAGWRCVDTTLDFSISAHSDARWAGNYRLALERDPAC